MLVANGMQVCFSFLTDSITNMKTPLEVLHKYFHHFNSERTRDLVVKAMEYYAKIYHDSEVKKLNIPAVSGSFPSDSEIETAALTYRDKSDDENTNEDTMMIDVHWYDKQEAFTAGVKWFLENYR